MLTTRLRTLYIIIANTAILLLVIQFGTDAALRAYYSYGSPLFPQRLSEAEQQNYAHMAPDDVATLLRASRNLQFRYAPVMGYITAPTVSQFINVDADGIRAHGATFREITALQGAVWLFGGSTTFGLGVADRETIPARLEARLGRPVINLGVAHYSSVEENYLLQRYLKIGYQPAIAIFLDGINESCWPGLYEEEMTVFFERAQHYSWQPFKPVVTAFSRFRNRATALMGLGDRVPTLDLTCERDGTSNRLRTLHARTMMQRDRLCRAYDTTCQTFVQPFAGVHGRRDGFAPSFLEGDAKLLRAVFEEVAPSWRAAGATFLTDALDGYDRHAYIDEVHYSAGAHGVLAQAIASRLTVPADFGRR